MIKLLYKWINRFFCKHVISEVYIHDEYFDYETDNDDLEDIPTLIKIKYCPLCGKIFSKDHTFLTDKASTYWEIKEFEEDTGLDSRKITLYKRY